MELHEVRKLIESGIPNCEAAVSSEGRNCSVVVVVEAFEGLTQVQRQRKVLTAVREPLASGALHAISMKVYTPWEWRVEQEKSGSGHNSAPA